MRLASLVVLVSLFSLPLPQSYPPGYLQGTHPETSFRGISASRAGKSLVLWVTGSNNFIFRSLDFGKSSASASATVPSTSSVAGLMFGYRRPERESVS